MFPRRILLLVAGIDDGSGADSRCVVQIFSRHIGCEPDGGIVVARGVARQRIESDRGVEVARGAKSQCTESAGGVEIAYGAASVMVYFLGMRRLYHKKGLQWVRNFLSWIHFSIIRRMPGSHCCLNAESDGARARSLITRVCINPRCFSVPGIRFRKSSVLRYCIKSRFLSAPRVASWLAAQERGLDLGVYVVEK